MIIFVTIFTVAVVGGSLLAALSYGGFLLFAEVGLGWGLIYAVAYNIFAHYKGIKRLVYQHFGSVNWQTIAIITKTIATNRRADFQCAFNHLYNNESKQFPILGLEDHAYSQPDLLQMIRNNVFPVPIQWKSLPSSQNETMQCATNALYCLNHQGEPYCLYICRTAGKRRRSMLQVVAKNRDVAQRILHHLFDVANELSVFRGSVVSLENSKRRPDSFSIRFHELPTVERQDIILPDDMMQFIDRNVLSHFAHSDTLRRMGQNTRRGILFYGPPGTGKTHVIRYLATTLTQITVILLTGRQLELIRESCRLARLLAPSVVVFEDVDLVAGHRDQNRRTTLLHELMDEMDGMGGNADCLFLLTTNRPDLIESALVGRPGRVDQAVCFPLPDRVHRERLFSLFGRKLNLQDVDIAMLLDRTEGATPAFVKELFRKAVLLAAERGEARQPMALNNADFKDALREMVKFRRCVDATAVRRLSSVVGIASWAVG